MYSTFLSLMLSATVWGNAPICAFDGYTYQCFYFDYTTCERAVKDTGNQRCVPNPEKRDD